MGYRLIAAATLQPVTLAEAKAHLRVDHTDEDDYITALIKAATSYLDGRSGVLGRCLVTQTWEMTLDAFPAKEIELPLGPVASLVSVKYIAVSGAEQTVPSGNYYVDTASLSARVVPEDTWPATMSAANAVTVRYVAGTAVEDVPAELGMAIRLLVGHWYANRQAVTGATGTELPFGVGALIAPFRRTSI